MRVRSTAETMRRNAGAALAAWRAAAARGPAADEGSPRFAVPVALSQDPVQAAMQRDVADGANMRRLLAFALSPDSSCIDVGANHGTVLAEIQRVAPHGRHIAFEPIPHLCELLRARFPGVEVRQAALSSQPGEADFVHVRGDADGWSGLRFRPLPTGEEADIEHIRVRLEALDEVLDPDFRPAVIKIDVEGAEQQVFEGALQTLRRHRPVVVFEHGTGSAETYGTSPADIHALLQDEAGFRIFDLDGNGPYVREEFERTFYAAERVNFVAHP